MNKRINGDNNSIHPNDKPIHDWYRFVLSYPPHLVAQYLDKFGAEENSIVLDPFCGTGTTPVECKKLGIQSYGVESNYMAYFASKTKVDWNFDIEDFIDDCAYIAREANRHLEADGFGQNDDLPLFRAKSYTNHKLLDLTEDQWSVLSKAFISPIPLHRSLVLLNQIRHGGGKNWTAHQELALAKALVTGIGNIAFGPEIGATKPRKDSQVVHLWMKECNRIHDDLACIEQNLIKTNSEIFLSDARFPLPITEKSVDFIITSPPYPNEKDYTRTTRLESVILGFINNRSDLKILKAGLLRSNTRNVFKADEDDKWVANFESITNLAKQIEERRLELGKTSGFERLYHRVVLLYFGGMKRHLEVLKPSLKPYAKMAYVVGDQMSYFRIPIRTGQILAEIAESLGYKVEGLDLWRTRLATATKEWLREEVVILSSPSA